MLFQEDWLLRQIEMMISAILSFLFKNYGAAEQKEENFIIQQKLQELLEKKKICEAENMIFDLLEEKKNDYGYLAIVLEFYKKVSDMSEEELNDLNFSHEEIKDGVLSICSYYNNDELSRMTESFKLDEAVEESDDT